MRYHGPVKLRTIANRTPRCCSTIWQYLEDLLAFSLHISTLEYVQYLIRVLKDKESGEVFHLMHSTY